MISQYARLHGVTVDQEFAIKKIREEMNELSGALSDGIVPGNIDSVTDDAQRTEACVFGYMKVRGKILCS